MADVLVIFGYLFLVLAYLAISLPQLLGRTPNGTLVTAFGTAAMVLAAVQDLAFR